MRNQLKRQLCSAVCCLAIGAFGYGVSGCGNPADDETSTSSQAVVVQANLASNIIPTGSVAITKGEEITDGVASTSTYSTVGAGSQWVEVDLGGSFPVREVNLWHYWNDARTYRDIIVQLSDDRSTWTTVFNNDGDNSSGLGVGGDAEYVETAAGKVIAFEPVNARYVRAWSNGSSANTSNHLREIQVFDGGECVSDGSCSGCGGGTGTDNCGYFCTSVSACSPNVAWSLVPTGSVALTLGSEITDGLLNTATYASAGGGSQWVQVDLGVSVDVTQVKLWHYWNDARWYRDVIFQLSNDGVAWTTVFNNDANNSSGQGAGADAEYRETAAGKSVHLASPVAARYVRTWTNGSSLNTGNHYREIGVFATPVCGDGIADQTAGEECDGGASCLADCTVDPGWAGVVPVTWTNVVGVGALDNGLTRGAQGVAWNAGAVSVQTITGHRGYVEFTTAEVTTNKMLGLSNLDSNQSYTDISHAIYLRGNEVQIYESGAYMGAFGTYVAGDLFRVEVEPQGVRYLKNGDVFATSGKQPVHPMHVDTSLYTVGATLEDVVLYNEPSLCGNGAIDDGEECDGDAWCLADCTVDPGWNGGVAARWTNPAGVGVFGADLARGLEAANWNAGAVSVQTITGSGYVEFVAAETNKAKMLGLSSGDTNQSYTDIDFAIYTLNTGAVQVYESGTNKGTFGTYAAGDVFRVSVEADVVTYLRNGVVFYTSAKTPVYPLLVDTSLYNLGATLQSVVVHNVAATCGDGILEPSAGEACDDGNTVDGDCCSADCTLPKMCAASDECNELAMCDIATGMCLADLSGINDNEVCTSTTNGTCQAGACIAADVTPVSLTAPAEASSGELVALSWTVTNGGNRTATGVWYNGYWEKYYAWNDRVYLSVDATYDAADTYVGEVRQINAPVAPGASYTVNTTKQFPNIADGAYNLLIRADALGQLNESDETNNVLSEPLTINNADLSVASVTAPSSAGSGELVPLSWSVSNTGGGSAGVWYNGYWEKYYAWNDRIYLSVDTAYDAADTYVGEVRRISQPLTPGVGYAVSTTKQFPNIADGAYNLLVFADALGQINESNETNNVWSQPISIGNPDLVIAAFPAPTAPASAGSGELVPLTWTVNNLGGGEATGVWYNGYWEKYYAWNDRIYLSVDTAYDAADTYVGEVRRISQPVAGGASYAVNTTKQFPNIADGAYNLLIRADALGQINESNETNNVWSQPLAIDNADLSVASVTAPPSVGSGELVALSWSVSNSGGGSAGVWYNGYWEKYYAWNDRVYLSVDATYDAADTYVGEVRRISQPVTPGVGYTVSTTKQFPNIGDGTYNLLVFADALGQINESDETNNVWSQPISIGNPDVAIAAVPAPTAPASAGSGELVPLTWTVNNLGGGEATGVWYDGYWEKYYAWNDRVYLSVDTAYDAADTYVGEVRRISQPVAGGASYAVNTTKQFPNVANGAYNLLIFADALGQLNESDETNNVWSQPITINNADLSVASVTAPPSAGSGELVALSWSVSNTGGGSAGVWYNGYWEKYYAWNDRVYMSVDATYDAADTYVGEVRRISQPVTAGVGYAVSTTKQFPNIEDGAYNLLVFADALGQINESDETNNVWSQPISIGNPDVAIAAVPAPTAPASAGSGELVPLTWTVNNLGGGEATGVWYDGYWEKYYAWNDRVYLSVDTAYDAADTYVGEVRRISQPVAGGASYAVNTTKQFPNVADGAYNLLIFADALGQLNESNETNNVWSQPITINNVDLSVASVTAPPSAGSGELVGLSWSLSNTGGGSAGVWYNGYWEQYYAWNDRVYLSVDATYDAADTYVGEVRRISQPVTAGVGYAVSTTKQFPNIADGAYNLLIYPDALGQINESDETNNVWSQPITIGNPDVTVSVATAPGTAASGELVPLTWTVNNVGGGEATGVWYNGYYEQYYAWNDRVYLSVDAVYDAADTYVGEVRRISQPVAGGASYPVSTTKQFPNIANGAYNLLIVADALGQLNESDETNNVWSQAMTIGNADLSVALLSAPATAASGEMVALSWTVDNLGGQAQGKWYPGYGKNYYRWDDKVYLSTDASFDAADTYVGAVARINQSVPSLQSYVVNQEMQFPNLPGGDYFLVLVSDGNGDLHEASESNNMLARPITLGNADLVVAQVNAPAQVGSGELAHLTWTVTNAGAGTAEGKWYPGYGLNHYRWEDRVYVSTDGIYDAGDAYVGKVQQINKSVAPGSNYSVTATLQVPNLPDGAYQLLVVGDGAADVNEASETNNVWSQPIAIGNADLSVASATAPDSAGSGELVALTWSVSNTGGGSAGVWYDGYWEKYYAWNDRVYLSVDATYDAADTYVGEVRRISQPVTLGVGYAVSTTKQFPNIADGAYNLLIYADALGQINESNEVNNVWSQPITIGNPDLSIAANPAPVAPASVASGEVVALSWTVNNLGGGEATGAWYDGYWEKYYAWNDRIYLSADAIYDAADTYVGEVRRASQPVAGGASYTVNTTKQFPNLASGSYNLLVFADALGQINESDESNNVWSQPITIGNADLSIAAFPAPTAPASVGSGELVALSWTVNNLGAGTATGAWYDGYWEKYYAWNDRIYVSTDVVYDAADTYVGEVRRISQPVAGGASYTVSTTKQFPSMANGEYNLLIRADALGQINESDETNNVWSQPLTIGNADLAIAATPAPDAPESAGSGEVVSLSWTVDNLGTGKATGAWYGGYWEQYYAWNDRIYLSVDAVYDAADTYVGEVRRISQPVAGGASYAVTTSKQLPNLASGAYHLLIRADALGQINESDETNNEWSQPITIANPDLTVASVTAPAGATAGSDLALSWNVDNVGGGAATGRWYSGYWEQYYAWNDGVYLSADAVYDAADIYAGQIRRIGTPLAAGASYAGSGTVQIPNAPGGSYYVLLFADNTHDVNEEDENNNVGVSALITLDNADLVADAFSTSLADTVATGQNLSLSWSVSNGGTGTARGQNGAGGYAWDDTVYLSTDQAYDAGDTYMGYLRHATTLAPGESYAATAAMTVPDVASGNYYLILRADGTNRVGELDDANNTFVLPSPISVQAPTVFTRIANLDMPAGVDRTALSPAFSPDGTRLAVAEGNNTVLWDLATFEIRGQFTLHDSRVYSVAFSPLSDQVVSSSFDGTVKISDSVSFEQKKSFAQPVATPNPAVYSGDGTQVLAASGSLVHVWDIAQETIVGAFVGHSGTVRTVAMSPDGALALSGTSGEAKLWSTVTYSELASIAGGVTAVEFSPDGSEFLVGFSSGWIGFYDSADGTSLGSIYQGRAVRDATYSPAGTHVASCDTTWTWSYGRCYLFERTGMLIGTYNVPSNERGHEYFTGIAFSRDSTMVATTLENTFASDPNRGAVHLWPTGIAPTPIVPSVAVPMATDYVFTIQPHGTYQFDFTVAADQPGLVINLTGVPSVDVAYANQGAEDPIAVEMFASANGSPSPVTHDDAVKLVASDIDGDILIAPTVAGTYSVLVTAPLLSAGDVAATIRGDYNGYHLSRIEPRDVSNTGLVTFRVRGTGFDPDLAVRMTSPSATVLDGGVLWRSSSELFAIFDMTGVELGSYTLEIERTSDLATRTIVGAVDVSGGGVGGNLVFHVEGPETVRRGRAYDFKLVYENTGDADVSAPYFNIRSVDPTALYSQGGTYQQSDRLWLASVEGWPGHVIPPHTKGSVHFKGTFTNTYQLDTHLLTEQLDPFNWSTVETQLASLVASDPDAWNAVKAVLGTTNQEVLGAMRMLAIYSDEGALDANGLFRAAMYVAMFDGFADSSLAAQAPNAPGVYQGGVKMQLAAEDRLTLRAIEADDSAAGLCALTTLEQTADSMVQLTGITVEEAQQAARLVFEVSKEMCK